MAKVAEKKNMAETHSRHNYQIVPAVEEGFTKLKNGQEDQTKVYTTLFCTICGNTKEIIAAVNPFNHNSDVYASEDKAEVVGLDDEDSEENKAEAV